MSRMKDIGSIISRSLKTVLYFISDERDIIPQVFEANANVFSARAKEVIGSDYFRGKGTYKRLSGEYIEDCHYRIKKRIFTSADDKQQSQNQIITAPVKRTAFFFLYHDFHLLNEDEQGRLLKQFFDYTEKRQALLLLTAPVLSLPRGYEYTIEVIDVPHPDEQDIKEQLYSYAEEHAAIKNETIDANGRKRIDEAVYDFKGLETSEIHDVMHELTGRYGSFYGRSAAQKKADPSDDLIAIAKARQSKVSAIKTESAQKDSTVTILEKSDSVAGLERYKKWLTNNKNSYINPVAAEKMGRAPIRGVLMTGLPGTGKTQGARYTAHELNVTLVQLRIDNLLGGVVGDSEKNFKRYRKTIEALAPCVVLIDEIEKLFSGENSGHSGSSEVKMNIFTALLDWMQENKKGIFFYATCNSASELKPELLRDGRFSMRFYVYMPAFRELVDIIRFHMKRINDMSKGAVFARTKGIVDKEGKNILPDVAEKFLEEISVYGGLNNRNMFFTGANIEALLNNVQYEFPDGEVTSKEAYIKAMMKCAESEFCQPYGETNLEDAVNFWLDALKNTFTDAAGSNDDKIFAPLSFRRFNKTTSAFTGEVSFDNKYDEYLYKVFSNEIIRLHTNRNKDERYMLEQISNRIDQMDSKN